MAKVSIVYWSGTGNTESMAEALKAGLESNGSEVDFINIEDDDLDNDSMLESDVICFGCSACGSEQINEDYFEPLMDELEDKLKGKKLFLFGSYGHGDGEYMDTWKDQVIDFGAELVNDPIICEEEPEDDIIDQLTEVATKIAK